MDVVAALPSAFRADPPPREGVDAGLWTAFWRDFCLEDVPHERCPIPDDGRDAVDGHWARFADRLPRGANVVDLCCGSGIVGRLLLRHRPDLRVTGVDFADVPAPPAPNLTILRGVAIERLPFAAASFDAAVSLFGIEYADIDRAARELARVLKPGARFSFLVHHHRSEIVREGAARRGAVSALLADAVGDAFVSGSADRLERALRGLDAAFPNDPSITLFAKFLRHKCREDGAARQATWQSMRDNLGPEVALLTRLQASAKSPDTLAAWFATPLAVFGLVGASAIKGKSGAPIAWQVTGYR